MAYANDFVKIDITGTCFDGAEIWNTGFKLRMDPQIAPNQSDLPIIAERVANDWEAYFTSTDGGQSASFSGSYATTEVKASHVGTDGYVKGNTHTYFYEDPIVGSAGGAPPLAQAAVVGTFRSEIQRGPGSTGRMYLPGIRYDLEDDGLMPTVQTRNIANNFNAFINAVNTLPVGQIVGMTVILSSPVGAGVQRDVIMTGVDRKVDTQRRRANALTSDYYTNEVLFQ